MKSCPQCRRTYSDETLSFCLEDGILLSASYNPQETNAPTFLLNAVEIPTVNAREVPTVAAARTEIPTVVNSFRPTQQMETTRVGWKVYLAGLIISLLAELFFFYTLYPYYSAATKDILWKIADSFDDIEIGYTVAFLIFAIPYNVVYYTLLSSLLGFIWRRASWKWGIIAIIPGVAFTLYYMISNLLTEGPSSPIYYVRLLFSNLLYLIVACLFSYIGSRLSEKIFNKPTA